MMDNTRKRKIVRNFVIGYLLLQVLVIVLYLGFWAVHPGGFVVAENERMSPPPMFPDYQGVTIPYNIAPLNFRIDVPAEKCYAKIEGSEQGVTMPKFTSQILLLFSKVLHILEKLLLKNFTGLKVVS